MSNCTLCPRKCPVDREAGETGFCRAGAEITVARAALHHWEEPCISGGRGSGTVFFTHCNLRCVFCQNWEISQEGKGKEIALERLVEIFLELQAGGAHNINLVSPTPYIPQIADAIIKARAGGLSIPIVYNSNAYESVGALKQLEGLVDVYLPDLKYTDETLSKRYSAAKDYFAWASKAILEMFRQVGEPAFDDEGLITRGLIIRHLILPGRVEDSKRVIDWISQNLPQGVYVSLMAQYTPVYKVDRFPELQRTLTAGEYDEVVDYFISLGLENGFIQEMESVGTHFTPDFNLQGL